MHEDWLFLYNNKISWIHSFCVCLCSVLWVYASDCLPAWLCYNLITIVWKWCSLYELLSASCSMCEFVWWIDDEEEIVEKKRGKKFSLDFGTSVAFHVGYMRMLLDFYVNFFLLFLCQGKSSFRKKGLKSLKLLSHFSLVFSSLKKKVKGLILTLFPKNDF